VIGIIYLGCVVTLGLLVGLASRERHVVSDGRVIFKFPKVLINTLKISVFVPGLLGVGIYSSFRNPGVLEDVVLCGLFGSLTVIILLSFIRTARFSMEIVGQRMELHENGRHRTINMEDVRRIIIVRPWRGRGRLDLIGVGGSKLCRIDGGVQDFDEAVDLIESLCTQPVTVEEKDTEGKWIERKIGRWN
jgi:hypothetical protein